MEIIFIYLWISSFVTTEINNKHCHSVNNFLIHLKCLQRSGINLLGRVESICMKYLENVLSHFHLTQCKAEYMRLMEDWR